jgi:hypothetical protein
MTVCQWTVVIVMGRLRGSLPLAEHILNVRSERIEGQKGGLDLVLAAEPVAREYCRNNTQHLAHRRAAVQVKLET